MSPLTHSPTVVAGTQISLQTEQTVLDSGKEIEIELNEKTGQTVLMRTRAWLDKYTNQ